MEVLKKERLVILYMFNRKKILKDAWIELLYALFLCFFGMIYEIFSHDVYSYFMLYAFLVPMIMGVLPNMFHAYFYKKKVYLSNSSFWKASMYTWSLGCILQGILVIFGTTNRWMVVYWLAGGILIIFSIIDTIRKRKDELNSESNSQ